VRIEPQAPRDAALPLRLVGHRMAGTPPLVSSAPGGRAKVHELCEYRRMLGRLSLFTLVCLTLFVAPAWADFTGKVITILDGDTIEVLDGRQPRQIRLKGIDCPEFDQRFGVRAKQATTNMAFGKYVLVRAVGFDDYGRTLREVILPDGRSLNRELLRSGLAWWYRRYSEDFSFGQLEAAAQAERLGLWEDPNPVPPWDWRRQGAQGQSPWQAPAHGPRRESRERSSGRGLRCCDGSLSPSCSCYGSHRGCCSHHGGVCGCE
jgi:micrococcal nuclease